MKQSIIYKSALVALSAVSLTACNDFLDTMPDNRAELDTQDKIQKLLVSAYPTHDPISIGEWMSDNTDDMGENNPYTSRFQEQVYAWEEVTEGDNSSPELYWNDLNMCVETANTVLQAIEESDDPSVYSAERAEALLCRAYANFQMVNIFALHYNTSDPDRVGISCIKEPETVLSPKYERGTVLENYADIQADIEEALPIVSDVYYTVPKYHFNQAAAYAFASQFYLYSEQWAKAIECADHVLGSNPGSMLRDWKYMSSMANDFDALTQHYIAETLPSNLLLLTSVSSAGLRFGPYTIDKRHAHCAYIGKNETVDPLAAVWGGSEDSYYYKIHQHAGTNIDVWTLWSLPYMFEYSDPVAGIGYAHTVYNAFTCDEILINRIEANIMLRNYDAAASDMSLWIRNVSRTADAANFELTPAYVQKFMSNYKYSYDDASKMSSTIKKHLHPAFAIDAEGSVQESMLQLALAIRRYETLHTGKRWFDIKRYGIVIPRRIMDASGTPTAITDWLGVDDLRRAVQIPQTAIDAGYDSNPRTTSDSYAVPIDDTQNPVKE